MKQNHKNSLFKHLGNQIHDLSIPLEIDELLLSLLHTKGKSGVRAELKMNREKILTFGRQMLTVAITQGEMGLRQKNMQENPWLGMARTARELEKVMDDFLWTCGGTRKEIGYILKSLRSLPEIMKISSPKNPSTFKGVMKEARNLLKAKGTIRWLARQLEKNLDFIGPRHNPGSPEKREFSLVIMEAWVHLTGKIASPSNMRFSEFLSAAWTDATTSNDVQEWEHHIRKVSADIKFHRNELGSQVPPWITLHMWRNFGRNS
jgi:hypothetical protein